MPLTRKPVELLAPAGTWQAFEAGIRAGADAIYLGGKRFNMRLHNKHANFDDQELARAIFYARKHDVRLYVTVNNLFSEEEIPAMSEYLMTLEQLGPDALIIQDLGLLLLVRKLGISIPLHASVMMNAHNAKALEKLSQYGVTRAVLTREVSLSQAKALSKRTKVELEYFIHGDMCISYGGLCYHSGIVFGYSSNRGRCLKPCRWPFGLADARTGEIIPDSQGPYKLAVKDMCMFKYLPDLIDAGIVSFKIEGRMRTATYIERVVRAYREAIDAYLANPAEYRMNQETYNTLHRYRVRDFSPCFAFGNPGPDLIGYSGAREPRHFSQAVVETGLDTKSGITCPPDQANQPLPELAVRVANIESLTEVCKSGADLVYIGGEAFDGRAWTPKEIAFALEIAAEQGVRTVICTPKITMEDECDEILNLIYILETLRPAAILTGNIGAMSLVREHCTIPIQADYSFNAFNALTMGWLKSEGVVMAAVSPESAWDNIASLAKTSPLPLELVVHGPIEAMILEHCPLAAFSTAAGNRHCGMICRKERYALKDTAQQLHPIVTDQHCRSHLLLAKDLCLLPYLQAFTRAGITRFRIEAQHYTPAHAGLLTRVYKEELASLKAKGSSYCFNCQTLELLKSSAPREYGLGVFRHDTSL